MEHTKLYVQRWPAQVPGLIRFQWQGAKKGHQGSESVIKSRMLKATAKKTTLKPQKTVDLGRMAIRMAILMMVVNQRHLR